MPDVLNFDAIRPSGFLACNSINSILYVHIINIGHTKTLLINFNML